jgi:hypothetical protein
MPLSLRFPGLKLRVHGPSLDEGLRIYTARINVIYIHYDSELYFLITIRENYFEDLYVLPVF